MFRFGPGSRSGAAAAAADPSPAAQAAQAVPPIVPVAPALPPFALPTTGASAPAPAAAAAPASPAPAASSGNGRASPPVQQSPQSSNASIASSPASPARPAAGVGPLIGFALTGPLPVLQPSAVVKTVKAQRKRKTADDDGAAAAAGSDDDTTYPKLVIPPGKGRRGAAFTPGAKKRKPKKPKTKSGDDEKADPTYNPEDDREPMISAPDGAGAAAAAAAAVGGGDDTSVASADSHDGGGGDEEEEPAAGAAASSSSAAANPKGGANRWSHADTVKLLDAVLAFTKEHGKPPKKSSKSENHPAAWGIIQKEIASKVGSPKTLIQCHNRFFNLTGIMVTEFKAAMAAVGATLATYIKQNFIELAVHAGVPQGTEQYRKFGDTLYKQWMDYLHLQTGSNPSLTLTPDGLNCAPVKAAFESAMSVPKRVQYQDYSSALLAIEFENNRVTSARSGMVAATVAERDQRVANAMAKANSEADKEKVASGEVPDGEGKGVKKPSKADARKAERQEMVAKDLDLKAQMVQALQEMAKSSMPPPAPVEFTAKFKSVEEYLKYCKVEGAARDVVMGAWPTLEDVSVLEVDDLTGKGVDIISARKIVAFRKRFK